MGFKQNLYVHSLLFQKLNEKNYEYATLAECFNIADNLKHWDHKTRRTVAELNYS